MKNSPARGLGRARWVPGNRVSLLENGEEFFPRVFEAVRRAQREVLIETFILYEDKVGTQLHACLCEAARRGVRIDLLVDGFGSPDLSEAFIQEMAAAGVRLRVFDPGHSILGQRLTCCAGCIARSWWSTMPAPSWAASTSPPISCSTSAPRQSRTMRWN